MNVENWCKKDINLYFNERYGVTPVRVERWVHEALIRTGKRVFPPPISTIGYNFVNPYEIQLPTFPRPIKDPCFIGSINIMVIGNDELNSGFLTIKKQEVFFINSLTYSTHDIDVIRYGLASGYPYPARGLADFYGDGNKNLFVITPMLKLQYFLESGEEINMNFNFTFSGFKVWLS